MQRYKPPMIFSTQKPAHMHPELDGDYVLHSEAQAEIERLQAEVERLTEELTASCARAEMQQREAERLRRNSSVLHDTIEKIFAEGAKQLARADTAHNDAIEVAALEIDCGGQCGACGSHGHCYSDIADTIRALKK